MNFNDYLDGLFYEYAEPPTSCEDLTTEECYRLTWLYLEEKDDFKEEISEIMLKCTSDAFGATKSKSLADVFLINTFSPDSLVTTLNSTAVSKAAFEKVKIWLDGEISDHSETYQLIAPSERCYLNETLNDDNLQRAQDLRSTL